MFAMSTSFATDSDDVRLEVNVSWEAFEAFLVARGEKPPRVAYLEGTLETMSPSTSHEFLRRALAMIVDEHIESIGNPWNGLGAWLMRNTTARVGLEPDESYVFGEDDKERPDLALEVVLTSGSLKKLELYRRFGVPEVWFWKNHAFTVHVLGPAGYEQHDRSVCLPDFDFRKAVELMKLKNLHEVKLALRQR
ncbi:Uma2 family endonuclease [soil metagenome]